MPVKIMGNNAPQLSGYVVLMAVVTDLGNRATYCSRVV